MTFPSIDGTILQLVFGGFIFLFLLLLYGHARISDKSKASKFSFEDIFIDSTGKTSIDKIGQFLALIVSTWAFIYYTMAYKLTEWIFWGYMVTWAAAKATNKWLEIKKNADSPASEASVTETSTLTVSVPKPPSVPSTPQLAKPPVKTTKK
jgi:hypothetical protein